MLLKMSEKKRWFSKINSDSQEGDADISWSNSDSDSEAPCARKRVKITAMLERTKSKSWINMEVTPPKNHISSLQPDPFFESPTFSEIRLEDQSPILTQHTLITLKEQSPVISRSRVTKKIKWLCKRKKEVEVIHDETTDASLSQSRLAIDSQSSPTKTQYVISPTKSELSQPYNIDPFPSQHSSEVISDSCPSSASDPRLFLYNQPPPRRKRFKKGTLASQLQKAVNGQNTSTAIWHHELFLNKSKGEECQPDVSGGFEFKFFVLSLWKEYGCSLLECSVPDTKVLTSFGHSEIENCNTFLLITGLSNPSNICFQINKSYQIFPPYVTKVVRHKLKKSLCIINASRFLSV